MITIGFVAFRMGKHDKIAARIAEQWAGVATPFHPCYLEYFRLFNARDYYGAHDVLEHIWLKAAGERREFYKALIQFAGGFVHLKHHRREPGHRIHGRRLHPSARLFRRCAALLEKFPQFYEGLDVRALRRRAEAMAKTLEDAAFAVNPWTPEAAPVLELRPSSAPIRAFRREPSE